MKIKYRLPEKIDRSKIYYKITKSNEKHYELQYHSKLIEDTNPFNDNSKASCVKGGIYFTTLEHLPAFFDYGIWIRPLIVPDDAKVILDPQGNKYRADKVYMLPRIPLENYITDFFDKNTFLWNLYSQKLVLYFGHLINLWWDPDKFNWEESRYLLSFCLDNFDIWWNPEKFDWENCSAMLAINNAENFTKWWNPEKFNWNHLHYLTKYCYNYFDLWCNPEKVKDNSQSMQLLKNLLQ